MPLHRRVGQRPAERAPTFAAPRVVLAREALWRLAVPADPSDYSSPGAPRGELTCAAYNAYAESSGAHEVETVILPLLRALASSRARCLLTLLESPTTFDAGRVRHAVHCAREIGVSTMVEMRRTWGATILELLAAAAPTYVRLSPDFVHGAGSVPDVFRVMVSLSGFARERGLVLVARNPRDAHELDALRAAGIGLVQWAAVPFLEEGEPSPRALLQR